MLLRTSQPPTSNCRGVEFSFGACGTKYGLGDLTSSGAVYMVPGRRNTWISFDIWLWGLHLKVSNNLHAVSVLEGACTDASDISGVS